MLAVFLVDLIPSTRHFDFVMDIYEESSNTFIIKIWLEETAGEANFATWRGHITHIPGGKRRYLKELNDVTAFILPFLKDMGVEISFWWRLRNWMRFSKRQSSDTT